VSDPTSAAPATAAAGPLRRNELSPRTRLLLEGPILATLLRLAWPNVLLMVVQSSTGLVETYWVSKLGTAALAGMAFVFPGVMLMQMISAGAMGGAISSAVARALGGGRREDADAFVLHSIVVNAALGALGSVVVLALGPRLYRALGGEGPSLDAALTYSNVVFAGNVLLWVMNALASVIRGTGNMLLPALVTSAGLVVLVPLSPCLIFGWGPFPALGIAGGGFALVLYYAMTSAVLAWYVLSGRNLARLRPARLRWARFAEILRVGALGAVGSLQTNVVVAVTTALVATRSGADAVAGFGTGARLEYLLIPLVFGLGAPLVALVGTNIGAGQRTRAIRAALVGGGVAFAVTELIGVCAALWPRAWLALFGSAPEMLAVGAAYLRVVGPAYGFFGLGLALYFASQGAGRVAWPLGAGTLRMVVAIGGGWVLLRSTGALAGLFAALALGLFLYGAGVLTSVVFGTWFAGERPRRSTVPAQRLDAATSSGGVQ
jgi:putative MATE family efflux protein